MLLKTHLQIMQFQQRYNTLINCISNVFCKDQCKIDTNEKYNNLQEWQPDSGDDMEIDGDLGEASSRMAGSGWTAEEMFNINTKQFGVKTSYDSKLTEYTVALKKEQIETK